MYKVGYKTSLKKMNGWADEREVVQHTCSGREAGGKGIEVVAEFPLLFLEGHLFGV